MEEVAVKFEADPTQEPNSDENTDAETAADSDTEKAKLDSKRLKDEATVLTAKQDVAEERKKAEKEAAE